MGNSFLIQRCPNRPYFILFCVVDKKKATYFFLFFSLISIIHLRPDRTYIFSPCSPSLLSPFCSCTISLVPCIKKKKIPSCFLISLFSIYLSLSRPSIYISSCSCFLFSLYRSYNLSLLSCIKKILFVLFSLYSLILFISDRSYIYFFFLVLLLFFLFLFLIVHLPLLSSLYQNIFLYVFSSLFTNSSLPKPSIHFFSLIPVLFFFSLLFICYFSLAFYYNSSLRVLPHFSLIFISVQIVSTSSISSFFIFFTPCYTFIISLLPCIYIKKNLIMPFLILHLLIFSDQFINAFFLIFPISLFFPLVLHLLILSCLSQKKKKKDVPFVPFVIFYS